ncbi:MAG TPA: IclR family transcriptional regulator [Nitrobacter sp.]|nr:IclR family transcriptional regulator [Nitrobacter sp.]
MKPNANASVKSADRAFDILEYIAKASEPPSFSAMLTSLGIPRSSLFHLLNNLLTRGYLSQDAVTGRYLLGDHIRQLAKRIPGPSLATVVTPFLRQLTGELNETSGFYVKVGDQIEALASSTSGQALTYIMKVGERAPLYAVSGGKIALTRLPPEQLEVYLRDVVFEPITPHTIRSRRQLRDDLAAVRQSGFAYSREEFTPGITAIGTAVDHEGQLLGTINLAVPTARFTREREVTFRRQLRSVAAAMAQAIAAQI